MTKRKRRYPIRKPKLPYLLPQCPLEFAKGIHTGEGSFMCVERPKVRRATFELVILMKDQEALKMLEPCLGTKVETFRKYYRLRRAGTPALEIAKALSVTTPKKQQITEALQKCERLWKKGYTR